MGGNNSPTMKNELTQKEYRSSSTKLHFPGNKNPVLNNISCYTTFIVTRLVMYNIFRKVDTFSSKIRDPPYAYTAK